MARLIASFFGTGLILDRARGSHAGSGTVGSLFALLLSQLAAPWMIAQVSLLVAAVAACLVVVRPGLAEEGDPPWVVIDEAAGTFLATLGLALGPALVAWVIFRGADIFKRAFPGVAAAERLPGAVGVVADDLVAGLYGLAAGLLVTVAL